MQNDNYNRGGYYAFIFSMAFSLLFFVYVTFMHPGINLKEVPAAAPVANLAEAAAPEQTKTIDISKTVNPIPNG